MTKAGKLPSPTDTPKRQSALPEKIDQSADDTKASIGLRVDAFSKGSRPRRTMTPRGFAPRSQA